MTSAARASANPTSKIVSPIFTVRHGTSAVSLVGRPHAERPLALPSGRVHSMTAKVSVTQNARCTAVVRTSRNASSRIGPQPSSVVAAFAAKFATRTSGSTIAGRTRMSRT